MTHLPARILGSVFAVTGVLHFTSTDAFASVVPPLLGPAKPWVWGSGVAELIAAGLLFRRNPSLGGKVAFVLLLAVWPANIYAALRGGYGAAPDPLDTSWAAWLRVPLQIPLLWLAWRIGLSHDRNR